MALVGESDDVLSSPSMFGLALRQIGWPKTYERVGLVEFLDKEGVEAFQRPQRVVLQIV